MRLDSFKNWTHTTIKAKELTEAGLFYQNKSEEPEETVCSSCAGVLKDWDLEDKPWVEHAYNHPNCAYVIRLKGIHFINEIHVSKKEKINKE